MPERMSDAAIVAVVMLLVWFRGNERDCVVALDVGGKRSDGVVCCGLCCGVVDCCDRAPAQHLTE